MCIRDSINAEYMGILLRDMILRSLARLSSVGIRGSLATGAAWRGVRSPFRSPRLYDPLEDNLSHPEPKEDDIASMNQELSNRGSLSQTLPSLGLQELYSRARSLG
eukprot:TRINITY_DN24001_c0_g1_i5.p1 TRINITY_DN24001_c0_g1~~TRINITY_DN24001_c0_g1_i5.p1  ORF type:complete len:106 (+),score=5.04 TRINITY_DN24001_c0_g1_i5:171-488(+)